MNQKIRILIIEDEVLTAMRLKQIISSNAYEVIQMVTTAEEALSFLSVNNVDLILADIDLNGKKDGLDFANEFHRNHDTPIIFITAQKDEISLQKASKLDHSGYLTKPFTADNVLAAIRLSVLKHGIDTKNKNIILGHGYEYHRDRKKLYRANQEILLTKKEQELLALLIEANGKICTMESLNTFLWEEKVVNDATRRNLVFKLKQKIPEVEIIAHKGVGYQIQFQNPT